MVIKHHDLEVPLDDRWREDAGMSGFTPSSSAYRVDTSAFIDRQVRLIAIQDIAQFLRSPGVPIFKDDPSERISGARRVMNILLGFVADKAVPPIVVTTLRGGPYRFKPIHGAHRLYCSLAAGFTHIPTVLDLAELVNREKAVIDQALC
jgi:hypothetical protein